MPSTLAVPTCPHIHHGHFWITSTFSVHTIVKNLLLWPAYLKSKSIRAEIANSKDPGLELWITKTHKQSYGWSKAIFCWEGIMIREITYPEGGGIQGGLEFSMKSHHCNNEAKWRCVQPCSELSKRNSQELESSIFPLPKSTSRISQKRST